MAEDKIPSGVRLSPEIHAKIKYICKVNHMRITESCYSFIVYFKKMFDKYINK